MRLTYILRSLIAFGVLLAALPAAAAEDPPPVHGGALCVESIVPPDVRTDTCTSPVGVPDWVGGIQDCRSEPAIVDCMQEVFREFWVKACLDRDGVNCAGVECDMFLPYYFGSCGYELPTAPRCDPLGFERDVGVPEMWEEPDGTIGIRGYFVHVAGECWQVHLDLAI